MPEVTRLVCVGDSFTEGMCDDLRPDGQYLGWADRVASELAGHTQLEYANLAVRGKLFDQIVEGQLPRAEELAPDILTFHAGGNDVLRRGTDLPGLFARYDEQVARLTGPGRRVLVFTCLTRTGGTGRLADTIDARFRAFNDNVRATAERHGAEVMQIDGIDALNDRRFWYSDRLHLNAAGHERVAAFVLEHLGVPTGTPGWWGDPLPPRGARSRRDEVREDLTWMQSHLLPWAWRRIRGVSSGDGRTAKDTGLRPMSSRT